MNAITFALGFTLGALSVPVGIFAVLFVSSWRAIRRQTQAERDHARFVEVMRQGWETR